MKINPSKSKEVYFTRSRVKNPLDYSLANTLIPEASGCKYLGIILRINLCRADQGKYTVEKAWKALQFTMRILKRGNSNSKSLAYMTLVRPILQYGAACWDPYREGQISALDRVQKKRPNLHIKRTVRTGKLWCRVERYHAFVISSKRTLGYECRLQRSHYLKSVDHKWKIRSMKKNTDKGKYSFVNWPFKPRSSYPQKC
jgi:hypothetical protein